MVTENKCVGMKGLNRVVLVGNLGKDPEVRVLNGGQEVARISVATTEISRMRTGELYKDTQWHTVIFWGSLAGVAGKYLRKGSLVYVEGKLRTRSYEVPGVGRKYVKEIIGNRLIMLEGKRSAPGGDESVSLALGFDGKLPF